MKKESNSTTNSTPSIDRTLSSIQQSSSSHTASQFTSNNDTGTPAEPTHATKSKNKKKKKKNKHKTQLPTMNPSQQMGVGAAPISDNQRLRHGTERIPLESLQHVDRGSIPQLNPPAPPASTSHHNYQQRHPISSTAKTVTTTQSSNKHNSNNTTTMGNDNDEFWSTSMTNAEERQKIREFWLQLGEEERRSLVKVEKEAVLRKMKEQQKHSCNCSVCGKKRSAIEDELEVLYDAYYEELEQYANHQQHYARRTLQDYPMAALQNSRCASFLNSKNDPLDKGDDADSDHDSEISDDDFSDSYADDLGNLATNKMARKSTTGDHFGFGNSLTVKGGILTVADDLLKNDGKKFLDMMERLAERRMQRDDEAHLDQDIDYYDDEEEDDDEIYQDAIDDDNGRTEEQRMEEGRRMFQIFAARMFEQRVLGAYREKVAKERQQRFIQELEEEDQKRQDRELKKQRDKERKKDKKRQLKKQQEQERLAKEAQRHAEEAKKRAEHQQKLDAERQRRELERQKKVEERRIKEEERRLKEEEKRRRLKEEKERLAEKERRRKEEEDRDRREMEFLKEKERKEKELKDELARRDRQLKEQILRHNLKLKERDSVPDLPTNKNIDSTTLTPHSASMSPSISLPQTESSNSTSITRQPKATQQSSTNTILKPGMVPSDLRQPTLFSPPCQPFVDILQPSHPAFGAPPPLDNALPSLAPLQYHQQPSSPSPVGVAPSALNIGSSASGISTLHHPMEPSLSSHGISPLMAIGQLHISNSSPSSTATNSSPSTASPNTATSPSISISPNHARRSSAVAGPIGSPVTYRFHGFGSGPDIGPQEMNNAFGTGSHRTSANTDGGQDYSFFSNFLFGDSNKGNPSLPLIDTDLAGSYQPKLDKPLDRKRQFSMDSQAHEWKNGWSATSMLAENIHGKLFGDALTERRLVILDRAKAAYRKLDEITQTNSLIGGTAPYHTLIQLHRMMNDLYCDSHVDLPELSDVLIHSPQSGFQCVHHPQHGILVSYYSPAMEVTSATQTSLPSTATTTTTPTVDDPLLLRRSSLLSHNPLMPTSSFPSYSLPSPFCYSTSTNSPSPGSPHHFLNPPPPPPQHQYGSLLPTNPLSPPPLSTSPFEYSPTPFTHTSYIEKSDT